MPMTASDCRILKTGAYRDQDHHYPKWVLEALCVAAVIGMTGPPADRLSSLTPTTTGPSTTTELSTGEVFIDPQGAYAMEVTSDWEPNHGVFVAEVEVWLVAESEDGFAPSVNVLTQVAVGVDLETYLELSIDNAPLFLNGFQLIDSSIIEGTDGQALATMEYTDGQLHYLGVFTVGSDEAIVATLTAPTDRFEAIRSDVFPHLLTLRLE